MDHPRGDWKRGNGKRRTEISIQPSSMSCLISAAIITSTAIGSVGSIYLFFESLRRPFPCFPVPRFQRPPHPHWSLLWLVCPCHVCLSVCPAAFWLSGVVYRFLSVDGAESDSAGSGGCGHRKYVTDLRTASTLLLLLLLLLCFWF